MTLFTYPTLSSPRRQGPSLDSFFCKLCHWGIHSAIKRLSHKKKVLSLGPRLRGDDKED